jgi:26S proteasome regulatory subunit N10
MVLESTMICVDNSDYMRNGDFIPSRLQSQFDAVNMVALAKTKSNPENNVGLLSMADSRVLTALTTEIGKIISKLHAVKPSGCIDLVRAIKVANLALKHRQSKNHKPRIIIFVASPVVADHSELVKLSKRLKKEKVNVDIVNFGEEEANSSVLNEIVNTINGKDGTGSHLVSIAAPANLSDALFSSAIFQGEDGNTLPAGFGPGFQYGMEDDPELAMALRISMEESRLKQEADSKKAGERMDTDTNQQTGEDDLLQQALALSQGTDLPTDLGAMTEEEQLNYALQMSLRQSASESVSGATTEKQTTPVDAEMKDEDDDYAKAMNDPEFLQRVISSLPGVDPNSDAIRSAVDNLTKDNSKSKEKDKEEKK